MKSSASEPGLTIERIKWNDKIDFSVIPGLIQLADFL